MSPGSHADPAGHAQPTSLAETWAVSLLALLASLVVGPFLLDLAGLPCPPGVAAVLGAAAAGSAFLQLARTPSRGGAELAAWVGVTGGLFAWLLWLARPHLLPLGTGPDLTHHLQLIRFIETHWRLVHDPALERILGEMAQYTPGSHLLAAFAGAWAGSDGLRALHPVLAATVALKAGFLFLIGSRLVRPDTPRLPLALCAPLLLFASPTYFLGSFTSYAFVAQVVAELFVVAMWWVAVAWDRRPDARLAGIFALAGAAAFLTWPVYTGPPALAFALVLASRGETPWGERLRHALVAFVPLGLVALVYLAGRLGWLGMAGTGGDAPWPSIGAYSWPLVAMAAGASARAPFVRCLRATALFALAVLAQAAAFFVLARRSGAPQPYMALKMFYLLLWPMCALAAGGLGEVWATWRGVAAQRVGARTPGPGPWEARAAVLLAFLVAALVARPLAGEPGVLHPKPPAVSLPLYEAGRWARTNVPAACVEYLVGDDETAYWLHLAELGNPRMTARTGDNSTYVLKDALLRWLTPGGLPYAIVDLDAVPRDVRSELDLVFRAGPAGVARRRGPAAACADDSR